LKRGKNVVQIVRDDSFLDEDRVESATTTGTDADGSEGSFGTRKDVVSRAGCWWTAGSSSSRQRASWAPPSNWHELLSDEDDDDELTFGVLEREQKR
jgi:hypothetical protein